MKTMPQKTLLASVILSLFSAPGLASDITLESKVLEPSNLFNYYGNLFYLDKTDPTFTSKDPLTKLEYTGTGVSLTAIATQGDTTFKNDPHLHLMAPNIDTAIGLSAWNATLTTKELSVSTVAKTNAIALEMIDSDVNIEGRLRLEALNGTQSGQAILMRSGTLSIKSLGETAIIGNIDIQSGSGQIHLCNASDRLIGKTSGALDLSIANGAQWRLPNNSVLKTWHWETGGILDVRDETAEQLRLEANAIVIGNDAVLKLDLADAAGQGNPDLYITGISNTQDAQILVSAENTTQSNAAYNIQLVGAGVTYVSLEALGTEEQNALYTVVTTPMIVDSGNGIWTVDGLESKVIDSSVLMNQQLDFFATNTIASEQMTDRSVAGLLNRTVHNRPHNGHWIDAHYAETELNFHYDQRQQTLETVGFEMGFDRYLNLPFLSDGLLSVSAAVAQSDVTMDQGDGEIDQWALNVYASGFTSDNYRLLFGAHYQFSQSELHSRAYLGNQEARFSIDRQVLGLSAYLGWVQSDFATSAWHIEPFVTGTSYWIKSDETSFNDLRVKSDNLHQSVVRLGATVGYRANRYPITWTAKAAWAHRFGQSVAVTGFADRQSAALATDDLKESWGELSVEGRWSNERGLSISARAQVAKSHDIKPKLEVGLQAKLRF